MQQKIKTIIQKQGFKSTPQRKAVLLTLQRSECPLSIRHIFLLARKECPTIGLATVYRTLEILNSEGLLHQIKNKYAPAYCLNSTEEEVISCICCGHNAPKPLALAAALAQTEKELGFKEQTLKVAGLCVDCAQKE